MNEACPSCGAMIAETFCPRCGERRPSTRGYSLRHFLHEAFETATDLDRSLLSSLVTLFRRPGELTAAYMRGERVKYLRPLQLFLLVNVVYFVWAGWAHVHVFNTRYLDHLQSSPYREQARSFVSERLRTTGMTEGQYRTAFDAKSLVLARSLIIFMAPLFALAVGLLSLKQRRPAGQHLGFSLTFLTYLLLVTIAMISVLVLVI